MLKFIQNNREITALLAVVLLFVLPGFLDRQYLSVQTLTMVYSSAQILILLAMGATLVMLTRNIDVSVGSITGMCAVLLGMLLNAGYSLPVACVATLLLGLLAGFFNGVLVAWLKIPAIVATLGTLGLYRGIMLLWTGGKWIEGLPAELKQLSAPLLFGVSAIGWLTIILVAFMAWLLAKTAFGRSFYATGDNLQGARQLGARMHPASPHSPWPIPQATGSANASSTRINTIFNSLDVRGSAFFPLSPFSPVRPASFPPALSGRS